MSWPDWKGQVAVVVASGPSAAEVPLEMAKDKARFIAVKDGWRLCPWADYLYACDHHWWEAHGAVIKYQGQRIAYDKRTFDKWLGISFLKVEIKRYVQNLRFDKVGHVGWGGNSGFHAINLAAQFGAKTIILVGFDMRIDLGKHFFGDHPYGAGRPTLGNVALWAAHLDKQADEFKNRGIEVINCSLVSALQAYPKKTFGEAIEKAFCLDRV